MIHSIVACVELLRSLLLIGQKELDVGIFIRDSRFHFVHGRPGNGRPTDGSHSTIINIRRSEGICLHGRLLLFVFIQQGNELREALPVVPLRLTPLPRFHHLIGRNAVFPAAFVGIGRVSDAQQNVQIRLQDLGQFPVHALLLAPLHDSYLRLAVQTQLHRHGHLLQPRSHCSLRLRALEPIVVELREDLLLHCAFKQSTRRCVLSRSNENRFDSSFARGSDGWLRAHLR